MGSEKEQVGLPELPCGVAASQLTGHQAQHSAGKHTPGPWEFRATSSNFQVVAPDGLRVTSLSWQPMGLRIPHATKDEAQANARLIAAAPDLLEALRATEEHFGGPYIGLLESDPDYAILEQVRAAIAKAVSQ